MSNHRPHFPITVLTYNATLIVAAAQKYPKVAARLADTYLADTTALIAKIPADVISQKNAQGETSQLTAAQQANFDLLVHYMNQARATAKLAFPGQTVKLHTEFQVGAHDTHGLNAELGLSLIHISRRVHFPAASLQNRLAEFPARSRERVSEVISAQFHFLFWYCFSCFASELNCLSESRPFT